MSTRKQDLIDAIEETPLPEERAPSESGNIVINIRAGHYLTRTADLVTDLKAIGGEFTDLADQLTAGAFGSPDTELLGADPKPEPEAVTEPAPAAPADANPGPG